MKKTILSVLFAVLAVTGLWAQNNAKINYQMVVRNANNELIANTSGIAIRLSLTNGENGMPFYVENHTLTTNNNGLLTFYIGDGVAESGSMDSVLWEYAYLHTELTIPGEQTQHAVKPVSVVPATFYAGEVDHQPLEAWLQEHHYMTGDSVFSTLNAMLSQLPENISQLTNDANYLSSYNEKQYLVFQGDTLYLLGGDTTSLVVLPADFSAEYDSLTNRPILHDSLSQLTNDANYLTMQDMPDSVGFFKNDAGYLTSDSLQGLLDQIDLMKNQWAVLDSNNLLMDTTFENLSEKMKPLERGAFPCVDTIIRDTAHIVSDSILVWRGRELNEDGIYYDSLSTRGWCDSIYFLRLIVDTVDAHPCPGMLTVADIDGNVYNTVQIGKQCWMKENLRTTKYPNGTSIELGVSTSTCGKYRVVPNKDTATVKTYGYLYTWLAMMDGAYSSSTIPSHVQGICPKGWHVPSDGEWSKLETYVASQPAYQCSGTNIAKALSSKEGWTGSNSSCTPLDNPATNNATGFSAMPAGYWNGSCKDFGATASFSSATETNSVYLLKWPYNEYLYWGSGYDECYGQLFYGPYADENDGSEYYLIYYAPAVFGHDIDNTSKSMTHYDHNKTSAFPVRCLKD